ncbi:hypothetical protein [Methylobacterium ajmalii]|uniref:hypothetical protein n=1 Tax=Methylobacterium ajmalii TaxID=2738439 RepID=UPI001909C8C1|nr:hypothetical protein [uncultured Methylobacterium sp.]MBK3398066.1 hypothetical protein [Methylobacterium ajmalii]MBK3406902.1 hypothetical protein [Methylobacterium ajmalii]MBZ6416503.1 hypothetical protein [Methylobacterium sp.]
MLDLLVALLWTPLGLGALVAAGAAIAALVYLPRLALPIAAVAVALTGAAYVGHVRTELDAARRERDEARADAAGKARAIEALESVSRNQDRREARSRETRRRIQAAPAGDDGPVAPVLRDVLEGGR